MLNINTKKNAQKSILFYGSQINSGNLIAQCLFMKNIGKGYGQLLLKVFF